MPDDQTIVEGDAGFLGMASRLNPLQLQPGMVQYCENMRLDRGVAQTRKGAKRLAESIGNIGDPITVPFQLALDKSISSITRVGTAATAILTAHGYATGDYVNIRGAAQPQYNGNFYITVSGANAANAFTYTMTADPGISASGTLLANRGPVIQNTYIGGIIGAGIYSSPRLDNSNEYIVLAGPNACYLWRDGAALQTISYPTTDTIAGGDDIEIIQAFDKLYLLRTREESLIRISSLTQGFTNLSSSTLTYSSTTITAVLAAHGLSVGQEIKISGKTGTDAVLNGSWAVETVPTAGTFTFSILTEPTADLSPTVISVASGTATATTIGTHPYQVGEVVRISGAGEAGYLADFDVTAKTSTQFSFTVPTATDATATGQIIAQRVQAAFVWDGVLANPFTRVAQGTHPLGVTYSRLPSTSTATYLNNTLIIARNRDELLISDVFDAETYDPVSKSFRANAGSNDYIVALHPYAEGQVLVFCRKSIWLATPVFGEDGVTLDGGRSSLQLLTNEVGCSARRSIATAGVYVFFLSDNGVYRLDNQFDLKLRGSTQTLSDPIADLVGGINATAVHLSNGIYHGNRYYLALPLGTSTQPNSLFAFNMLNQQWESRDTYGFPIDRLLVSDYGTERRLFAATAAGKLFLLDEQETGADDTASGLGTSNVAGLLLTRRYGFDGLNAKRLLRAKASVVLDDGAACTLDAVTTDYDKDFQIASLTNASGSAEDYTIKAPLRCKATALDLRFRTSAGRPILRTITAEAARSGMSSQETRTLN
jgi:hypothetical protein